MLEAKIIYIALVLEAKYIALDLEARSLQVSTSSRHFFGKSNSFELLVHHGSCQKSIGKDYRVTFCTTIYTLCSKLKLPIISWVLQSTAPKKMATGTFTDKLYLANENPKNALKNSQKSSKNFKPSLLLVQG